MKAALAALLLAAWPGPAVLAEPAPPWADARLGPDRRAELAVAAMTLDEKLGLLSGQFGLLMKRQRPGEPRIGAGYVPGVPRLGLPELFETDAGLGVANSPSMRPGDTATAMPSALATAAGFDPALAFEAGAVMGAQARAKGFNVLLAGGANLTRDAWAGRNFEYLGEDVWLSGVLAGESIRGVQSQGIVSTLKHFALNSQETGRYVLDARIGEAALRESDLLAFQIALERGRPGSVMCAYNRVNGPWACENDALLNGVLKRDWGFPGWVMSDWGAVHSTTKAALAGLDQQSGREMDLAPYFGAPLKAAVQAGEVPPARVDDMARRILRSLFAVGVIDRPPPTKPEPIDAAAGAAVAQRVAEAGTVLLRNEGGLLPLREGLRRILVVGGRADVGVLSGGGSSQVWGTGGTPLRLPVPDAPPELSFIQVTYQGPAPLQALRERARGSEVAFVDGRDLAAATAAAREADVVIVFAEQWRTETADLETLALPGAQDALITALAAAQPRTVVVLQTGGAVLMPWLRQVGAVLLAWYPGERGGAALARVLFGDVDAGGRLPISFPARDADQPRPLPPGLDAVRDARAEKARRGPAPAGAPFDIRGGVKPFAVDYAEGADLGYRWFERTGTQPLFPFGFGLSYTRFGYAGLVLEGGATPRVRFTVTNLGARAGSDVPQVYAAVAGADGRRIRRLVGFERVTLAPGESRSLQLALDPRLLARFDAAQPGWVVAAGELLVVVGRHAGDRVLQGLLPMPALRLRP